MDNMPSSCNNGFQATVSYYNVWHWLKVQEVFMLDFLHAFIL